MKNNIICQNIRMIRTRKGLTQKQAAANCGMAEATFRTYELGRANPKPATVAKIAKGLGVFPAELYGIDEQDPENNIALYQILPIDNINKIRLITTFNKLNNRGQTEAIKRLEELTQIQKYAQHPAE